VTADVVYLYGRPYEMPPLVTTVQAPGLNLCDDPIISATCATLVNRGGGSQPCGGLLAYQSGAWQHVNACRDCLDTPLPCPGGLGHVSCGDPEPVVCMHGGCREPADISVQCTNGAEGECDGCCWISDDELEGRRMWPR
jgi:hypothetical protein